MKLSSLSLLIVKFLSYAYSSSFLIVCHAYPTVYYEYETYIYIKSLKTSLAHLRIYLRRANQLLLYSVITCKNLSVCYTHLKTIKCCFLLCFYDPRQWKYYKKNRQYICLCHMDLLWYSIWGRLVEKQISSCIFMAKNV